MREKMTLKTHTLAVALSAGWPMLLTTVLMAGMLLMLLPGAQGWQMVGILVGVMALTYLMCLRMYLGEYLFLPATAFKGPRIIARLGSRKEIEISGVLAGEVIIRQSWLEKRLGVCHIRQQGLMVHLRGVPQPEQVRAWVAANFPAERRAAPAKGKKRK